MDAKLKARWIDALNTYPKTQGHLKDNIGYCCLGVLCEVYGIGFSEDGYEAGDYRVYTPSSYGSVDVHDGNELSNYGRELFGLTLEEHNELTGLNDENDTFQPVISYIGREL